MTGSVSVVVTTSAVSTAVTAGGQTSCATHNDGTLWCWGRNNFGQLGDGTTTPRPDTGPRGHVRGLEAGQRERLDDLRRARRLHPVVLGAQQLRPARRRGARAASPCRSAPTPPGPACPRAGSTPAPPAATAACGAGAPTGTVSSGWAASAGLRLPHKVGPASPPGRRRPRAASTPAPTRTDGTAWCWGQNIFGQLGNANPAIQPNPVQVGLLTDWSS